MADDVHGPMCNLFCAFQRWYGTKNCKACYEHEIMNGILLCEGCGRFFPVIDGIPRFNPDWAEDFPSFQRHYEGMFPGKLREPYGISFRVRKFKTEHASTKASFGFQWLNFAVTDREEDVSDFFSKTGVTRDFLRGKLILDAGCGMGRFLMVSACGNNEVVGLDLSRAVERAYGLTKSLPFVHVIQGDLMRPPLRKKVFDFIYSIGVLHHTPSTEKAFHSISDLARRGGTLSVWVYQKWVFPDQDNPLVRMFQRTQEIIFDCLRKITVRLPHKLLHYLCYVAVPLGWAQMRIRSHRWLTFLFWPVLIVYVRGHERWQIRLLDTFDWYSPAYQWKHTFDEVFGWFRKESFERVRKTPSHPVGVTGERQ